MAALRVSVVVPTRDRAMAAIDCVRCILATSGFLELIVIDQSGDDQTELGLAAIGDDRLRYVRSPTRGVTRGRNAGIELARGEIIAFTDDDCRVSADWAGRIREIFEARPDVAVVSGRVRVPEEVQRMGYTEGFEPRTREWHHRFPPLGRDWGITANLSIRRSTLATIGLFDPILGSGAPLRSGGEPDFL